MNVCGGVIDRELGTLLSGTSFRSFGSGSC